MEDMLIYAVAFAMFSLPLPTAEEELPPCEGPKYNPPVDPNETVFDDIPF